MLDAYLKAEAYRQDRAVLRRGRLHVGVRPDARVLTMLTLAGEDTALHAVLFGSVGGAPEVGWVPDPRHRDDLFRLYRWLGRRLDAYFAECLADGSHPQIWVASRPAARLVGALADRLRNARSDAQVRRAGDLLSYPASRYPVAGQQSLVAATEALCGHYATGQQPSEDGHLGAVLEWLEPLPGLGARQGADVAALVPMGVHTDPNFDAALLMPALEAFNLERKRGRPVPMRKWAHEIRDLIVPVAETVFEATSHAARLLGTCGLSELPQLDHLEAAEADAYADFCRSRAAGYQIPNRDSQTRAAFGLLEREVALENYAAAAVIGDPVERARAVLDGRVVRGVVARGERVQLRGRVVHRFDIETTQRALRVRPDDEWAWADDPRLRVLVGRVRGSSGRTTVSATVIKGSRLPGVPTDGTEIDLVRSVPGWSRLMRARAQLAARLSTTAPTVSATLPTRLSGARSPLLALGSLR